jgi:hypothetical protein
MRYRIKYTLIFTLSWLFFGTAIEASEGPFEISLSQTISNDGVAVLSWSLSQQTSVVVQKSQDPDFSQPTTLYRGSDSASVITGLMDGKYFFRARSEYPDGSFSAWSETVSLSVEHHSLAKATLFFAIGGIVFLATMLLITFGAKRGGEVD